MSIVSSNMISKHYCPQCESFDLLKLHRTFVQKRILGSENKLQCRACGQVFKPKALEQNIAREVPVFLETSNPISLTETSVSNTDSVLEPVPEFGAVPMNADLNDTDADLGSDPVLEREVDTLRSNIHTTGTVDDLPVQNDVEDLQVLHEPEIKTDNLQVYEDDFKVTETVLQETNEQSSTPINPDVNQLPPHYTADEHLIDETILVTEKKGMWPYVVASLFVLFGAAYALIWMPMNHNAEESETVQMDMSIGKPVQMLAGVKHAQVTIGDDSENKPSMSPINPAMQGMQAEGALEKVAQIEGAEPEIQVHLDDTKKSEVTVAQTVVEEEIKPRSQLVAAKESEVKISRLTAGEKPVKMPLNVATKFPPEASGETFTTKIKGLRYATDLGTKSDRALGGLSSANTVKNLPVNHNTSKDSSIVATSKLVSHKTEAVPNKNSNLPGRLAAVPLVVPSLKTSVRQYVVKDPAKRPVQISKLEEKLDEPSQSEKAVFKSEEINTLKTDVADKAKTKAQQDQSPKKLKVEARPIKSEKKVVSLVGNRQQRAVEIVSLNKKAAALLGVSAKDLTLLTSTKPAKRLNQPTPRKATAPVREKQSQSPNSRLLEKAAVKFIQQDLDKLLPN